MKKLIALLALLGLILFLVAGCGGKADTSNEATSETAGTTTEAAETVAATHDCDGGCGMKDVPMAQLTEIDGKYYCASCAAKLQEGDDTEGHEEHGHG